MAPTLREDIVTLTPDLVHEAVRRFTAADGIFAVTERQVALAWLLTRSPQVLPIPGSGDPEHVEQNIAAATIELTAEETRAITLALLSR